MSCLAKLGYAVLILCGWLSVATAVCVWNEANEGGGDAGDLPGLAPQVTCETADGMIEIQGSLDPGNLVDMFMIQVSTPEVFSARADTRDGTLEDPQLFLFGSDGRGVYANDNESEDQRSPLLPPGHARGPSAAGIYYVAISTNDRDPVSNPVSSDGRIFPNVMEVVGPDGPGGGQPVSGWIGGGQSGTYTIRLNIGTVAPPAPATVFAKGVGLLNQQQGIITLDLPDAPVIKAFLAWQGSRDDKSISLNNGAVEVSLEGEASEDPEAPARFNIRCFHADISDHIIAGPVGPIDYTVAPSSSTHTINGAGIIAIVSNQDFIEASGDPGSEELLKTVTTITLGPASASQQRIEVKAGCDLFFSDLYVANPVTFNFDASMVDREAKFILMVSDSQSSDLPRHSDILFASPADALPISLGKDEDGLNANDGCFWDTFGRNSGLVAAPDPQCHPTLFAPLGDPDSRGDVTIPAGAPTASITLFSPASSSDGQMGVSGVLTLAVFQLIELPRPSP